MKKYIIIAITIIVLILTCEKVKADTLLTGYDRVMYKESALTNAYSLNNPYYYKDLTSVATLNASYRTTDFHFSPISVGALKKGYITIPFYVSVPYVTKVYNEVIETSQYYDCAHYICVSQSNGVCTDYQCSYASYNQSYNIGERIVIEPQINIYAYIVYDTGYTDICTIDQNENYIKCNITSLQNVSTINRLTIQTKVYYNGELTPTYYIGVGKKISGWLGDTQQIINNQEQIKDTLTQDHTYNNNASEQLDGGQDLNDMTTQQENILDSIDTSSISSNTVYSDTNANTFIWNIVERLRGMSNYIVLLMTSILGIGIIKMVLNR